MSGCKVKLESCRACMANIDSDAMYYLYNAAHEKIFELFKVLTSLEVDPNDGLPGHICHDCLQQLLQIQKFRNSCLAAHEIFRDNLLTLTGDVKEFHITMVENDDQSVCDDNNDDYEPTINMSPITKSSDSITCYVCGELFVEANNQWSEYAKHMQMEHSVTIGEGDPIAVPTTEILVGTHYECDLCAKVCLKKHRMEAHLRQHRGLKPFACDKCGAEFKKWSSFSVHQRKHQNAANAEMFQCEYEGCPKFYDRLQSLKLHQNRVHLGKMSRQPVSSICETCGKSFKTEWFLKEHRFTHLDTDAWPYPCEVCPKRFISKYKFKIHMMRHNNIKNFACPMCDMRTCTNKELQIHIAYHNKDVSFPCEMCASVFRSKVALQRHVRIVHRGHKPYICTFCGLAFAKAETLKHHTMRHTGERPHGCTLCDRRFIQVVALRAHMKTHDKNKEKQPATTSQPPIDNEQKQIHRNKHHAT